VDVCAYLTEKRGISLSEQQLRAVRAGDRHILLLAVPGSGKTTVLVSRAALLLHERGVPPKRVLCLTYSRETVRDMKRRYGALFGELGGTPPAFATIHSFSFSVMRTYAARRNRPMPRLIEEGVRVRMLREIYRSQTGEFLSEDTLESLTTGLSYVKNAMLPPEKMSEELCSVKNFPEIFSAYESCKRRERLIDFDDMLVLALDIFRKCPEILAGYQERISFLQVDEAQDASLIQHRIIGCLAQKAGLFMVGDEDQSIYGFRGACPEALLTFGQRYPDAVLLKMEENFRSRSDIVRQADAFIRQNRRRYEKHMFTKNPGGDSIQVLSLPDYAGQAEKILSLLRELPEGKTAAVLYRNNESAIPVLDLLEREDTPFYIRENRLSFFSSTVVRDLSAYIVLSSDQRDLEAFSRIYYKLGLSRGIFSYVREHIREYDSVFDCVRNIPSLPSFRREQMALYRREFERLFRLSPGEAVDHILWELGYGDYIENRVYSASLRMGFYQKLGAVKCLGQRFSTVFELLDRLETLERFLKSRERVDEHARIVLSTLHSSKGMEFDWVILLDTVEDILPSGDAESARRMGDTEEYEGEVRLFYVGVTRARERVILFRSRKLGGTEAAPSPFLEAFTSHKP